MKPLDGKYVLITAGPTREYIDPVRYISNDSSGQMGLELADAAKSMGAKVTVVCGPVGKVPPKGVGRLFVVSAEEMLRTVKKYYRTADIIIMTAAVADWRPARYSKQKIKKKEQTIAPSHHRTIALIPTPDILKWLGAHKRPHQILIGFALETEDIIKNARIKMKEKNCDYIVANHVKNIASMKASISIIDRENRVLTLKRCQKSDAAKFILKRVVPR